MKFGKSYMETLASPSFPKEWRDGAIEYKQLKKLINGVVAELESLGLSADVLRDLIVPPEEEAAEQEANNDEAGLSAGQKSAVATPMSLLQGDKGTPPKARGAVVNGSPHLGPETSFKTRAVSDSHSEAKASLSLPDDSSKHFAQQRRKSSTAAAEWVATIAHHEHHHEHGKRRSSRDERGRSSSDAFGRPSDSDVTDSSIDDRGEGPSTSRHAYFAPSTMSHGRRASEGSVALDGTELPRLPSSMGKKDLQAMRRSGSSAGEKGEKAASQSAPAQDEEEGHDWDGHAWRERAALHPPSSSSPSKPGIKAGKWVSGKDGRRARAEYELGGTAERPEPRIRLFVESPITSDDEALSGDEADAESESEEEDRPEAATRPSKAARHPKQVSPQDSPGTSRLDAVEKTIGSDTGLEHDDRHANDSARFQELTESPHGTLRAKSPRTDEPQSHEPLPEPDPRLDGRRVRVREIVIPLNADTEFLDTLTGALSNLSTLQEQQRQQFEQNTEALCNVVQRVASPGANKSDMYAWREIFALWCELQIFESLREKDRGELSVEESERRLKQFADELAKRGWDTHALDLDTAQRKEHGKKLGSKGALARFVHHGKGSQALPMKDPRSIAALEEFMKLNLALLDVKKFQRVNVEAARKILKKHDKRTALTASSDLGAFVEQQESMRAAAASAAAGVGVSGLVAIPEHKAASTKALISSHGAATHPSLAALLPTSTSGLVSSSLPHILLSLMSSTLLPILPSIDDYSCAICTDVAWRPIKLDCSHLFCIRCLVKLQKQGKADCPLCRAPGVVESADEHNMDPETVQFLQDWFPKEVKQKQKDNDKDRHREELLELGLMENERCIVV